MRIGLTFDLREEYLALGYGEEETAEFDAPETIDALAETLGRLGHEVDRIGHIRSLVGRLAAGERWDLVFNIAEGLHGVSREAQVPALLEAFEVPYVFSDPLTLALTLDKAMAKRVVRDQGVATAPFLVLEDAAAVVPPDTRYPLFVKPLAEGTGKGVSAASRVGTEAELRRIAAQLIERHAQPVIVEEFLPGREFTVGVIGTGASAKVLGVMEILPGEQAEANGYTYENKEHYEGRIRYRIARGTAAREAAGVALAAWRALRCRDGGRVDLRCDASGRAHFLEVNPLAGLHPTRSDLVILAGLAGVAYPQLIASILDAALARTGAGRLSPAPAEQRTPLLP